jgi:hypothetical protein
MEKIKRWTSHTMTSENFLEIQENYICYGVESLDDEQAFSSRCLIVNFIDSEADWWAKVNLSQHYEEIKQAIRRLL